MNIGVFWVLFVWGVVHMYKIFEVIFIGMKKNANQ